MRFLCCYGATSPAAQNQVKTKTCNIVTPQHLAVEGGSSDGLSVKFKGECVATEQDEPLAEHMGTGRMKQNPFFLSQAPLLVQRKGV